MRLRPGCARLGTCHAGQAVEASAAQQKRLSCESAPFIEKRGFPL